MEGKKVLLMGRSASGKTSMRAIIFANYFGIFPSEYFYPSLVCSFAIVCKLSLREQYFCLLFAPFSWDFFFFL